MTKPGTPPLALIPDPDELPRVLTRAGARKALGVSQARLRAMEKEGKLHPRKLGGVHYFERGEVLQLAHARGQRYRSEVEGGPKAAEAFRLFDAGARLADVVIKLELVPELVREFYAQWVSFRGPAPLPVEVFDDRPVVRRRPSAPDPRTEANGEETARALDARLADGLADRRARISSMLGGGGKRR